MRLVAITKAMIEGVARHEAPGLADYVDELNRTEQKACEELYHQAAAQDALTRSAPSG
jgi:hypothetical protein